MAASPAALMHDEQGRVVRILSVDLGTSNTVAVLATDGRPPRVVDVDGSATMPSAVFADEDGTIMVGRDAERRARLDPTRFEPNPKRRVDEQTLLLGTDVVPVSEALAAVLRRVLDEVSRQLGGEQPDEVRLTHPAQWGPTRRNVLMSAARLAGISGEILLVPEPVAAAAHFASFPGKSLAPGQALAVYDLGAGTFDVAVVGATPQGGYTVLAEDGLPDLGGLDVDQALLVHVGREVSHKDPQRWQRLLRPESTADRRTRRTLQEDVKAAKEALSRHPQTEVPMPEPFEDVLVTRGELEALVRPAMLRSVELVSRTLRSAGMTPSSLAGIYLVGGSSRLPLVGTMISEKLGVVPVSLDQPETAVALGAVNVASDGISSRTQNVTAHAGATGTSAPPATTGAHPMGSGPHHIGTGTHQVPAGTGPVSGQRVSALSGAPMYPGQTGGYGPSNFPSSGPQPALGTHQAPSNFPSFPVVKEHAEEDGKKRKNLMVVAGAALVIVLLAVVGVVFMNQGGTTYTAEECQQTGQREEDGFTGCLRQLAGSMAETKCEQGMGSGPAASRQDLGVAMTCSAPNLPGGTVTYVHGKSQKILQQALDSLLNSTGGTNQVRAQWKGNGLDGKYSAATGTSMALLTFSVDDRPLIGFVAQYGMGDNAKFKTPDEMADYFERYIQPGEA